MEPIDYGLLYEGCEGSPDTWSAYKYGDLVKVVYFRYKMGIRKTLNPTLSAKKGNVENNVENEEDVSLERPRDEYSIDYDERDQIRLSNSVSRTRSTIFEIALCNEFTHFCTFTQDQSLRDRFDLDAFRRDLAQFIRNQNRKPEHAENRLQYLIIPEQHKDGAWHAHGLMKGFTPGELAPNEFGFEDWLAYRKRFGFFSVSPIRSHGACSKYITKYVTKDMAETNLRSGAHLYYASTGLKRKSVLVNRSSNPAPIPSGEWDFENEYIKVAWLPASDHSELTV